MVSFGARDCGSATAFDTYFSLVPELQYLTYGQN
jgi:hypothetical protein